MPNREGLTREEWFAAAQCFDRAPPRLRKKMEMEKEWRAGVDPTEWAAWLAVPKNRAEYPAGVELIRRVSLDVPMGNFGMVELLAAQLEEIEEIDGVDEGRRGRGGGLIPPTSG